MAANQKGQVRFRCRRSGPRSSSGNLHPIGRERDQFLRSLFGDEVESSRAFRVVVSETDLVIAIKRDRNVPVNADALFDGFRLLFAKKDRLPRENMLGLVKI